MYNVHLIQQYNDDWWIGRVVGDRRGLYFIPRYVLKEFGVSGWRVGRSVLPIHKLVVNKINLCIL